jgi:MFS family permease
MAPSELISTGQSARSDRRAATLALLAFAMLIVSLDQYIVVVALPEIGRALDFSAQTLQAVISAYAVASAGFLLLGGRASDLLGRRRVFVSGLALYAGGSLAGGLAPTPEILLGARAAQGLGGALVFPSTLALINTTFAEGAERNRAVGVWGGAGASGLVIGVLLGGVLTQALGWEAVFFVNVPLVALALVLAFALIPPDRERERRRRFDLPGALGATLGITLIVFALVQGPSLGWGSVAVIASAVAGVLSLAAFALIERRGRDPLVPPRLLANRNLSTAVAIAFLFWATFGSVLYFSPSTSRTSTATTLSTRAWRFSCRRPWSSPAPPSPVAWRLFAGCGPRWSGRWPSARWAPRCSAWGCRRTARTGHSCPASP